MIHTSVTPQTFARQSRSSSPDNRRSASPLADIRIRKLLKSSPESSIKDLSSRFMDSQSPPLMLRHRSRSPVNQISHHVSQHIFSQSNNLHSRKSCVDSTRSELVSNLTDIHRSELVSNLADRHRSEMVSNLNENQRSELLSNLTENHRSDLLSNLTENHRSDLVSNLAESHRSELVSNLADNHRVDVASNLADRHSNNSPINMSPRSPSLLYQNSHHPTLQRLIKSSSLSSGTLANSSPPSADLLYTNHNDTSSPPSSSPRGTPPPLPHKSFSISSILSRDCPKKDALNYGPESSPLILSQHDALATRLVIDSFI